MLVQGPSNICTHPWSIPIDTFAFVGTGGNSNGCEKGVGEAVGVGVIEGVGVGVGVAVGEAVGVGLGIDVVYWIASAGGNGALSSVEPLRRRTARLVASHQPAEVNGRIIQPRLHIGNHLRRTPGVRANRADRLARAHRAEKVPAFRRPKWYRRSDGATWHRWEWRAVPCLLLQMPEMLLRPSQWAACLARRF